MGLEAYQKQMAYDALAVANYFLDLAAKEGKPVDPMGIQKLVYFAHGWNLAIFGSPLVQQRIEAWEYGPVIADVYEAFKGFGRNPITEHANKFEYNPISGFVAKSTPTIAVTEETKDTRTLLEKVWNSNKHLTSIQMSNLTHLPDSPWSIARQQGKREIDDALIRQYIENQARENDAPVGPGT